MTHDTPVCLPIRSSPFIKWMAGTAVLLAATASIAADFPVKPVRIVVPYPPGGSVDLVARMLSADLGKAWGQQVIVDNHPGGASGSIGTELAKRAAPDGSTLLVNTLPFVTNQFFYSTMPYDPIADFVPISVGAAVAAVVVVHPSLPVHTVAELVSFAKSKPAGAINYASSGPATNPYIASELLNYLGKINLAPVHYKGGGPAMMSTISGETQLFVAPAISYAMPQVEAGRLRALGVTSLMRSPLVPQLPTLSESGLPGYEFLTWHVFAAPAATPRMLVNQIHDAMRASSGAPGAAQRWRERGVEVFTRTPEESVAYLKQEIQKWRVVITERGMKAE